MQLDNKIIFAVAAAGLFRGIQDWIIPYHIYPKYWDTSTHYNVCPKLLLYIYPKYCDILTTYSACPKLWISPYYSTFTLNTGKHSP